MSLKAGRPTRRTQEHVEKIKAQLADAEPEKRLNVRMPLSEYRKLKQFAFERDVTISDVVRGALREYMSQ